ncbi:MULTISPECIES: T9SS type A sorting domain-containing protein [Bizionia]|uniref:T9SS type A sorting domain-containing protein n=1 Tax=Bizionia algoritergicola TaxID=291187 RepID=A0A5D0QWT0_9FLAO|nr:MULTISPECIES: T9SS type A sorting domain-containing protein [Bizionia]OBX22182.1 hypothetical protein BAA08_09570 [Bizionia sp. APA-3]TYB73245.1 T9SS type A sorting domain-containing protein [Bizionia algoritergicola]
MKKTTLIACLFFATQLMYSQKAIPASGGNATGSGGSSSYTVGQLVYTTNTGSGTLTQGVQQSIELFTLSNPELTTVNLTAVTYPNPTSDYVVLAISDAKLTDLSYALFDLQGRAVVKGSVSQERSKIGMQNLASGTYILKVNQNNQALKTFKIIKK